MRFKVPQFLEIEDKIFGPFTFRQFAYLVGGGGMCFLAYRIMGFYLGILPILIIGGFSAMLAFYRPNNKPFINMVESGVKYVFQDKLYIWKKRKAELGTKKQAGAETKDTLMSLYPEGAKLTGSKLRDLAWSLDVLDLKK